MHFPQWEIRETRADSRIFSLFLFFFFANYCCLTDSKVSWLKDFGVLCKCNKVTKRFLYGKVLYTL